MGACFLSLKNNVESALSKCGDSLLSNCIFNSDEKKKQPKRALAWLTHFFFSPLWWLFMAKTHRRFPLPLRTSLSLQVHMLFHAAQPPPTLFLARFPDWQIVRPASSTPHSPSSLPDQWGLRSEDEPSARSLSPRRLGGGLCAVTHTGSHVTVI